MKKRFSEEQIIKAIKQHEAGAKVEAICRQLGTSNDTFYNWCYCRVPKKSHNSYIRSAALLSHSGHSVSVERFVCGAIRIFERHSVVSVSRNVRTNYLCSSFTCSRAGVTHLLVGHILLSIYLSSIFTLWVYCWFFTYCYLYVATRYFWP